MTDLAIADDRALGGSLRVIVTRPVRLAEAKATVDRLLREVDAAASRFRADSELSRINATPETEVRVSPLLGRFIAEAMRAARITDGAVDPTVGRAVRLAGYDVDFDLIPRDGAALRLVANTVAGWQAIRYDEA